MEPSSKNFSAAELRCKCDSCKGEVPNKINPKALAKLQKLRDFLGLPISLSSAYRCANHPDEIKKTTVGRHEQGIAFDIRVPWGPERGRILQIAFELGFRGFGFANSFLHIDYRVGEYTTWSYS